MSGGKSQNERREKLEGLLAMTEKTGLNGHP